MFTRAQYMNRQCSHRQYYSQFVGENTKRVVKVAFGERLKQSTDEHFNDIRLDEWDRLPQAYDVKLVKTYNYNLALSDHVCIMKEAARQILEE